MAIQFHCPYCTAVIKVPDEFSGRKGSCPKCATQMIVPVITPAPSNSSGASPNSGLPTPSASDAVAPGIPTPVFVPPAAPEVSVSRKLRKKSRRRSASRFSSLAIPVICLVLFFAVLAAIMTWQQPELKGILRGSLAVEMKIPTVEVSLATLGVSSDLQSEVMAAFSDSTEAFSSSQMICRIGANETSSLTIDIRAGDGFEWFVVNPANDSNLSNWIREHKIQISQQRLSQIATIGAEMCKDKLLKASGTPIVFDAERYRDVIALGSHVVAFGYVVEAVAGSRKSLCAHEDANGSLYFALPADTTSFTLRGRRIDGSTLWFPGEYTIQVGSPAGNSTVLPPKAAKEPGSDDPEKMTEPTMDGESPAMPDSPQMEPSSDGVPMEKPNGEFSLLPKRMAE